MTLAPDRTFSVAPMMDWTDRHCRRLHRTLSGRALLWTEMVTADAVIHGDRERLLGFDPAEAPLVLQLGGSDPARLAEAARIGEAWGYSEINLNCGCPSDRVQNGRFGACLMAEPELVARCVAAMAETVSVPVTVKCRIAIDDLPSWETLRRFAELVHEAGCAALTVHARKAWLKGLSPKENRDVPPLDYELVAALKADFSRWPVILNGGITSLVACQAHLQRFDGVMLGRAAYQDPALLGRTDAELFGDRRIVSAEDALRQYRGYMAEQLDRGVRLSSMTRHMMGLFNGRPGARAFRRILSTDAVKPGAGLEVLDRAMGAVGDLQPPARSRTAAEPQPA